MAATYHWTHDYIERELSDELLVLYLDDAIDRQAKAARVLFADMVEAVRAGTIFAHDRKQHGRWRSEVERTSGQPTSGKDLAQLVRDLGGNAGGLQVVEGEFEFRN